MNRSELLQKAAAVVCDDRQKTHGDPRASFTMIAELWQTYLQARLPGADVVILPADVAALMALLKIARAAANPQHDDNWVDLAGYAACGAEMAR